MYPVTDITQDRWDCPRTKTPWSRASQEAESIVFVSLVKGMKNREVPRFELTRTARAAPICPPSFRSLVSINRLRGRGWVVRGVGERTGKIATPVSIRWPLPHLGEIVRNAQFKTVVSFLDHFAVNSWLSLKQKLPSSYQTYNSQKIISKEILYFPRIIFTLWLIFYKYISLY